jgi:uncharacterized protein YacL
MKFACKLRKTICWFLEQYPTKILIGFCIFTLIAIVICIAFVIAVIIGTFLWKIAIIKLVVPYIGYVIGGIILGLVSYIIGEEQSRNLRNKFCNRR